MPHVVVPFRGEDGKSRLPAEIRSPLALAMLGDVLEACIEVGPATLVTNDETARALAVELGAGIHDDPGGGQGAAVAAALAALEGPVLVVNADLPSVTPEELEALLEAAPALVEAADGTTNALSLPDPAGFAPLYGPGSAARFRAHLPGIAVVALPGLADDVDTLADLERLLGRVGPRTRAALAAVEAA